MPAYQLENCLVKLPLGKIESYIAAARPCRAAAEGGKRHSLPSPESVGKLI